MSLTRCLLAPLLATAVSAACAAPVIAPSCLVGATGIGPVSLGMTLAEAQRALPGATFARSSDGDGVALITVSIADSALFSAFAGEDDASAPLDSTATIRFLETFNPSCATISGIGPGSLVADVEGALGATTRITLSEIESREYIEFERQPAGLLFRLDYSGRFADGARETKEYDPGAKIFSIGVVRQN